MAAFGEGVREAARIFARDARNPTGNELATEIEELHRAVDPAKPRQWDRVAMLLESLSPKARDMLIDRGARPALRIELPSADAVRDPERRETACDAVSKLCQFGSRYTEGRRRPSGKRSRPDWRPVLFAPEPQRNFAKRDAERDFVMWLSIAWHCATDGTPPRTARHPDASRQVGPFARFVRECLRLVGAGDADAVELINKLHRRRRVMEKRASEKARLSHIKT